MSAAASSAAPRWRGLVVPLALLAIWFVVTQFKLVNTLLLVRPDKVIASAITQ